MLNKITEYSGFLDVKDVQQILSIGRPQAYKLVKSGAFHTVRVGNRIKISKATFKKWLEGEDNND
jgi:excisionase family DNA binding protein